MKGYDAFKGYRTRTAFNKETGQFTQQRVPIEGLEAKAKPARSTPLPVKIKPSPSAAQRLAALKRRIEAGRASAKAPAQPHFAPPTK